MQKQPSSVIPLTIFLSFIYMHAAKSRILRLPCHSFADFTKVRKGFVLNAWVLSTYQDLSTTECQARCIQTPSCKAINSHENGSCILNSDSPTDPFGTLTEEALSKANGWTFKSTEYHDKLVGQTCRSLSPCGHHFCLHSCSCPGYRCITCGTLYFPCNFVPDGWTYGDGDSIYEIKISSTGNYETCERDCLLQYSNANGATVDFSTQKNCYCEFGQTGVLPPDKIWINKKIR